MTLYRWSVLGLRFGLLILSFYLMGSFVLRVEGDSLQMVSFRVILWDLSFWATYIVLILSFYLMGSFVLRVEGDSLQMVSFRVKVWVLGYLYCLFILWDLSFSESELRMTLYRWSVLGLRFGLLILSFYLMGSFVLDDPDVGS